MVFRPLFRYREQRDIDREDLTYLFPAGHYKRRGQDVDHHLYPVFQLLRRTDDQGFAKLDYLFFPFVIGGDHPGEGSYLTVWPFGGTLRGLLFKEYILSVLFPVFAYTRVHDYETYHVLFPFVGWEAGAGNEGWHFLPFYGHRRYWRTLENETTHEMERVLVAERTSVLFPIFEWEVDNKNGRNPFTAWVVFPFYGETRSRLVDETTVLWPFFRHRNEKADGISRWRIPFPLVMLADGNETQRDFFPFIGYRRNHDFERWFMAWPFVRYERQDTGDALVSRRWLIPVMWLFVRKDKASGKELFAQRKLWPLIRFDRGVDGLFSVHAPSLLWFRDDMQGTFETVLSPLWELFRYTRDDVHGKELRLLFSTYIRRWGRPRGDDGWTLFGGLLGHRETREGEPRTKLFWFIEF